MVHSIQETRRPRRIIIDVGGVITDDQNRYTDPERWLDGSDYLNTPLNPGIIEAIGAVVADIFGPKDSFVVSKCSPGTQVRTREFFDHIDFYESTGIPPDNVYFSITRQEKAEFASALQATDAVDDRLENLGYLREVGPIQNLCLFMPSAEEVEQYQEHQLFVQQVNSSREMLAYFRAVATDLRQPAQ